MVLSIGGMDGRESSSGSFSHLCISSREQRIGDTCDVARSSATGTLSGSVFDVDGFGSGGGTGPGSLGDDSAPCKTVRSELSGDGCSVFGIEPGTGDERGAQRGGVYLELSVEEWTDPSDALRTVRA